MASREESEAAARDERRLAEMNRNSLAPTQFSREDHDLERYELFSRSG